ncbi:MAG: hypothetical protein Q8R25_01605 [bacterium]|nr:hypothetical protein [bacterium]
MEHIPEIRPRESGSLDGKKYDIEKVYAFAESIPIESAQLEEFRSVISKENDSWFGIDEKHIQPHEIVENWNAIQKDPAWAKHVASINNANLDRPILVSHMGHVLDGQHRVIKSFLQGSETIKVKRLPVELPKELEMSE